MGDAELETRALADLVEWLQAEEDLSFGRNYIIPKPFDERLLVEVASAVVNAAMETGVARVTDIDIHEYRKSLEDLAYGMHRANL